MRLSIVADDSASAGDDGPSAKTSSPSVDAPPSCRWANVRSFSISLLAGTAVGGSVTASQIGDWLHVPGVGVGGLSGSVVFMAVYFLDVVLHNRHLQIMAKEERTTLRLRHRQARRTMVRALKSRNGESITVELWDGTRICINHPDSGQTIASTPDPEPARRLDGNPISSLREVTSSGSGQSTSTG